MDNYERTFVYGHQETDAITNLLIGRKVILVENDTATLDNGLRLTFVGNEGACQCGGGDYDLTELNTVDNIITSVEFEDSPSGDDCDGEGYYKIFVFADNQEINLATFIGSDGNGYYGTGYYIRVDGIA